MGAREQVLDLLAGFDVPFRHARIPELFHDVRADSLAFPHGLHHFESRQRIDAFADQVHHDVVA